MIKFSTGSAIAYGTTLPASANTVDGALFFLSDYYTDKAGSPSNSSGSDIDRIPGLYLHNFQQDLSTTIIGDQVGQGWKQVTQLLDFVEITGDTMTGPLAIQTGTTPGLKLESTQPAIWLNENDQAIGSQDWTIMAEGGSLMLQARNASLSTVQSSFNMNRAGQLSVTQGGNTYTVWHSGNDGAGSSCDADLLDGQQGAWYMDLSNAAQTNFLPISKGGTGTISVNQGGIVFGLSTSAYSSTAAGTVGQVLLSGGTGAPGWANQSSIAAGSAAVLATARTIGLSGAVTGSASFDGSSNITITTSFVNGTYVLKAGDTMTGILTNTDATQATNTTTGAIVATGGLGVGGNIWAGGQINAIGDVVAYASDARLKKNVTVIDKALSKIASLGGYVYDWDLEKTRRLGFTPTNPREHGVLAQEVQKVMPDAVAPAPFNQDYLTVKYERLVSLLIAGMNEQQLQIEQLKAEIALLRTAATRS